MKAFKMVTAKQEVESLLSKLPNDCSLEDIQYHLYVIEKVRQGLDAADTQGGITQEEAEHRLEADGLQNSLVTRSRRTTEAVMSTTVEELLRSFELLPDAEKGEVASEMLRRAFASTNDLDDAQLTAVYAEFAETDSKLAEEGIEDYERGLVSEDAE